MNNLTISKNLGIFHLNKLIDRHAFTIIDAYKAIKPLSPYYGTSYDIVNMQLSFDEKQVTVLFKAVHFSIPTADSIDYTKVIFKEKSLNHD